MNENDRDVRNHRDTAEICSITEREEKQFNVDNMSVNTRVDLVRTITFVQKMKMIIHVTVQ
jgi:hypothetical protein